MRYDTWRSEMDWERANHWSAWYRMSMRTGYGFVCGASAHAKLFSQNGYEMLRRDFFICDGHESYISYHRLLREAWQEAEANCRHQGEQHTLTNLLLACVL